ncbi:MAG: TraB/GumN family protein [Hyphomicrobiaceae bacterium]|nr:TraB/GumN family protein [Hyphomicrobiaceae bacterium]
MQVAPRRHDERSWMCGHARLHHARAHSTTARVLRRAALAALLALAPAGAAGAADCRGTDMLAAMSRSSPDVYREIQDTARATANAEAILWKIERAGVPASYLLGTIHLTDRRVTQFSAKTSQALDAVRSVALEVTDISAAATSAALEKSSRLVLYTDGRRLDGVLSAAEIAKVRATLSAAGMPVEISTMFKPWVISLMLSVSGCERRNVQRGEPVLDMKLATTARQRGKTIIGLETIESQLQAMAAIPDDQQVGMLRASLAYADRADDNMETLLQLYLQRRMGAAWPFQLALARQAGVGPSAFVTFKQRILVDRNRHMAKAALPLLSKGRVLIAVGAMHLVGDDGLVALLEDAGYTLTPIE